MDKTNETMNKPAEKGVKGVSLWADAWKRLKKNKMAMAGGVVIIVFTLIAIFADFIAPYSYKEQNPPNAYQPPSFEILVSYSQAIERFEKKGFLEEYETTEAIEMLKMIERERMKTVEFDNYLVIYSLWQMGILEQKDVINAHREYNRIKREKEKKIEKMNDKGEETPELQALKAQGSIPTQEEIIERLHEKEYIDKTEIDYDELKEQMNKDRLLPLNITAKQAVDILIEEGFLKEDKLEDYKNITDKIASEQKFPHLFGTDNHGRDLFSRIIYGSRVSLSIGFATALVSLLIGVTYGAISGFAGGKVDNVMMRFVDILYGIPYMFFVILLMSIAGRNFYMLFIGIGAVSWMTLARITRGQIISLKNNEYIEAARSIGASRTRIIFKHLLPNAFGPIIVYITLTIPRVMLSEAFLSFLGLGVQPPMTSWGLLASEGKDAIVTYPWLIIFPGVTLAIVLFFLNFLGEGLRDALDPSLKNKM